MTEPANGESTPPPGLNATIGEAREWLETVMYDDGDECPCCTQFVKVYRRKISALGAASLCLIAREHGTEWVDLPAVAGRLHRRAGGGDEAKLRYWGLIEPQPGALPASTRTGIWRLTQDGIAFARGQLAVQKYARVFNGFCLDLVGPKILVTDALGEHFDYRELMGPAR